MIITTVQDYKGTTGGLDVVMKNIVYDYYSKDLSVKVTTAKRAKMKRGEYIGGHVPYGLKKDPDDYHKLQWIRRQLQLSEKSLRLRLTGCAFLI